MKITFVGFFVVVGGGFLVACVLLGFFLLNFYLLCLCTAKSCLSREAVSGEDAHTDPPAAALPQTAVLSVQKEI